MESPQQILQAFSGLSSEIAELRTEIGHLRDGQQRVESGMRVEAQEIRKYIRDEVQDLKSEQITDLRDNTKRLWLAVDELRKRTNEFTGERAGALGLLHWLFAGGGLLLGALGTLFGLKSK